MRDYGRRRGLNMGVAQLLYLLVLGTPLSHAFNSYYPQRRSYSPYHVESESFSRSSVESPPNIIEDTAPVTRPIQTYQQDLTSISVNDPESFSRGAVEASIRNPQQVQEEQPKYDFFGAAQHLDTKPKFSFYGAAQYLNNQPQGYFGNRKYEEEDEQEEDQLASSQGDFYPARSAVESYPRGVTRGAPVDGESSETGEDSSAFKIICYYGSWSIYRPEPMNIKVSDIDPFACSHLIYSFAGLDNQTWEITSLDPEQDIVKGNYLAASVLKKTNPNLRVMIAIGGWNEGGLRYSQMAADPERREIFVNSVIKFLDQHNFDGIDLDWEYPGATDRGGTYADKKNFADLVNELSAVLRPRGLLLSAAVSAAKFRIDEGYDVPAISKKLDFINVMTYDLHGFWDNKADHHALLKERENEDWAGKSLNTDHAIQHWIKKGAPAEKVILGIPFYGRSFTLADKNDNKPGAATIAGGTPGVFTNETGFLAYYEICYGLNGDDGWQSHEDRGGNPYAVKGNQWVGYDNPQSIGKKMDYVKKHKLGGAMVWAIDLDDVFGVCNQGKWPLISRMNDKLNVGEGVIVEVQGEPLPLPDLSQPLTTTTEEPFEVQILVCKEGETGLLPSTANCEEFYQCGTDGSATKFRCSDGLKFDAENGICNWPDNVDCSTRNGGAPQSYRLNKCSSVQDGLYSDPVACEKMFWCQNGIQHKLSCPFGQFFDPEAGTCSYFAKFRCPSGKMVRVGELNYPAPSIQRYLLPQSQTSAYRQGRSTSNNVVCYFANWAVYRDGAGKYVPENIPSQLCSHVVYAFARLDAKTHTIALSDELLEISHDYFNRMVRESKARNPKVKTILAIGGWADSAGNAYSVLVNSPSKRQNFVRESKKFLKSYGFDGISIDWQYPVCWQSDCSKGPASDKQGFAALLQELKEAYGPSGLIVMTSISGFFPILEKAYDFQTIGQSADLINVMTYDYHGFWDEKAYHHSPLKATIGVSEKKSAVGAPIVPGKPASPGPHTIQGGMLAYHEICSGIKSQQWTKNNGDDRYGPHAYSGQEWVSFDDPDMMNTKGQFIIENGFGGATLFTIDFDDFNNECCQGPNPNLNAISQVLRDFSLNPPADCTSPPPVVTPPPLEEGSTKFDSFGPEWVPTTPSYPEPQNPGVTVSTTDRPATIKTTTAGTVVPEGGCKNGAYYPDPADCSGFMQCVNNELNPLFCGAPLLWNDVLNICDWDFNVNCANRRRTSQESLTGGYPQGTLDESQVENEDNAESEVIEEKVEIIIDETIPCQPGVYEGVPEDCSAYIQCLDGKRRVHYCPEGLFWNLDKITCDFMSNVECQDHSIKADRQILRAGYQESPCGGPELIRDPNNCQGYLQCDGEGSYLSRSCGAGLNWNNIVSLCDYPDNAPCDASQPEVGDVMRPQSPGLTPGDTTTTTTTTPRPINNAPLEVVEPTQDHLSGDYKVVCYFTNWAWYRRGVGKYRPEDIDPELCTHIVYGFAVLDYSNKIIKTHDSWADIDNKFYEKVVGLKQKNKNLKVTLAIGGWNDSQGPKYSDMVNNPASRKRFINHALDFVEKHGFDGLDLDWEYPKCWQTDCNKGPDSDKEAFSALIRELSEVFKPKGLLLSAAVSPNKKIIEVGYEVPQLAKYLDWIAVMSYDYHGHWDKKTGHVAPMYVHEDDEIDYFNTNYTIHYWLEAGIPKEKLIMGMPLYGQAFSLQNPSENGLNAPAPQKGQAGPFTQAAGFLAYYEICNMVKNKGYTVVEDKSSPKTMGPYAFRDRQWVSYDDVAMIRYKSEYIRKLGLGGGMVWALDLDDFNNVCGQGVHPLMNTIKKVLGPQKGEYPGVIDGSGDEMIDNCDQDNKPETGMDDQNENMPVDIEDNNMSGQSESDSNQEQSEEYKVVCYFTNWAWYRQGPGKYLPAEIDPSLCTHIVYGFAVLDSQRLLLKPHDKWADFDNEFYQKVTALKSKTRKVLLALGGWNDSAGDKYSRLVNNPAARAAFTKHVVEFLEEHNFDGLDLDWEYPKCWQVDCSKGPESDKHAFTLWVQELSVALKAKNLLLTAAVSPSKAVIEEAYEVQALSNAMDYISIMTYDYHGQWDKKTGHNYTVFNWLEKGLDKKKLILGMPMYGQSFTLADANENGLAAKSYGGGEAGHSTRSRGFLAYYEICEKINEKGWQVVRDPENRMGPYAFKGDQWVGFDDIDTIRFKSEYVKRMGLGGAMIWALDLDDFKGLCGGEDYPLLKTINRALGYRNDEPNSDNEISGKFRIQDEIGVFRAEFSQGSYSACSGGGSAKIPGNCAAFQVCINGEYVTRPCAPGTVFNGNICDWPNDDEPCMESNQVVVSNEPETEEPGEPILYPDYNEDSNGQGSPIVTPIPSTISTTTIASTTTQSSFVPGHPGMGTTTDTGMKVVCYFTNWAWYRPGIGKYVPEDIDPNLCTHVNYGFAVLDPDRLIIKPHDTWADIDSEFYNRVNALQKKGVKVLLALGGWNDSEGNKYSRMVNNESHRKRFVEEALRFVQKYSFDGLDLDWEYPKCWQVDCDKGPISDKENFANLVKELSAAFKPHGLLLTAAVSPSKAVIDAAYDVPIISQYLDIINVMTYDYHGHWDKKTGHVAPLFDYEEATYGYFNTEFTMNYWKELGADSKKLVLGMPMYGQAFTLNDASQTGLNSPGTKGMAGMQTRAAGFLAYYEICKAIKEDNWAVKKHPEGSMGPYAFKGNQWVGFDDSAMIRKKSQFVKDKGYGGAMIWALDLDDFRNVCGCEHYPLLRTINRVLRGLATPDPKCDIPESNQALPRILPYQTAAQYGYPQYNPFYMETNSYLSHGASNSNKYPSNQFPLQYSVKY
ncbi:hypothetical protein TCAL_01968 [Tigriopus californicus]|uniref:chitinase n=1 Tax=Tigriopus californicus TaxID=6832 RepID=A0A553PPY6_TIGCA|nr:hypothetical protein TCAL_01968 [Tigriopus californicus]